MKTLNEIQTEIDQLIKQIETLNSSKKEIFQSEVNRLLEKHKGKVGSVTIGLNNHEFNDGNATYFSLYVEDLALNFTDELGNEYKYGSYPKKEIPELELIRDEFVKFFGLFDDDFYESIYSGKYDKIVFKL